jgi:hypothetical protein
MSEKRLTYGLTRDGLEGFADANWGNNEDDRHSICGYAFCINKGEISWSSKKQNVVASSSTEAEYIALMHAAKEAVWLQMILIEIYDNTCNQYLVRLYSNN